MQDQLKHYSLKLNPHLTRDRSVKELRELEPDIGENQIRRVLLAGVASGRLIESTRITGGPGSAPKVYRLANDLERNRMFSERS